MRQRGLVAVPIKYFLLCLFVGSSGSSLTLALEQPELAPLPEPLTLDFALSQVDITHPDLQVGEAAINAARAEQQLVESDTGIKSRIIGRLRWVEPPSFNPDRTHDDHRLGILVDKKLYDFGRTSSRLQAVQQNIESQQILFEDTRQQRRIEIMQRYFDVVLADLQFYQFNEAMAVAFIELDKRRDRNELGQVSDIQVLEQEAEYQRVRKLRFQSQNQQRLTRARLAYVLGRPGQLPDTVSRPGNLPQLLRALPEVEILQAQAMEKSSLLRALRAQIAAGQAQLAAARAGDNPVLYGNAQANTYSKERANYDKWRVGVQLEVPLTTGGRVDADAAKQQAELYRLQAELTAAEEQIKQTVLELWLELDALLIQREQMQAQQNYRELSLDRSRALYELEVRTNLGDSMVRVTEAERQAMLTDFNIALAWEKMDTLTGSNSVEAGTAKDLPQSQTVNTTGNEQ
jgi:outer membrane protein TolC